MRNSHLSSPSPITSVEWLTNWFFNRTSSIWLEFKIPLKKGHHFLHCGARNRSTLHVAPFVVDRTSSSLTIICYIFTTFSPWLCRCHNDGWNNLWRVIIKASCSCWGENWCTDGQFILWFKSQHIHDESLKHCLRVIQIIYCSLLLMIIILDDCWPTMSHSLWSHVLPIEKSIIV